MPSSATFDLPARLAAKTDPELIAADERHFARLAALLERTVADLADRLAVERRRRASHGQDAVERDLEVRRLAARLQLFARYRLDLCLGRMVRDDGTTVYIGRTGLTDADGDRVLVDWRSPAAEPFFGATHADPMGLASRRRYRWTRGRITDYWDEVFTPDGLEGRAALDDQSAFIASLGGSRSARMRDVLGTIQADQDAIIRADSRGPLVIDGGPGTGKTVVALHRTAYLLYADARVSRRHGGVLVVGPHRPYLDYIADVLPSLGEDGVRIATVRDLVAEGADASEEPDARAASLKADPRVLAAVEAAVRRYERPPRDAVEVDLPWGSIRVDPRDWAIAFDAADAHAPHNEARDQVWDELLAVLAERYAETDGDDGDSFLDEDEFDAYGLRREASAGSVRRALGASVELARAFNRAWPLLDPAGVVADLWSVPGYLDSCAPDLAPDEVAALRRDDPRAWTVADLPILDAARARIGDPEATRRRRRHEAAITAERARMSDVIDHLLAGDDSDMQELQMLRGQDLRSSLVDDAELPTLDPDELDGPFAHIVIDEAQELTDAEWAMILRRCPSRSLTIVGDRAQARHGFTESWETRLGRVGLRDIRRSSLTINYRTPEEVMREAEPVIRAAIPDANVPTSIRSSGVPVRHGARAELDALLAEWLESHDEGVACVIGDPSFAGSPRVRSLEPVQAKGLEFDLVVLVDPDHWGGGIEGAVDRYVAMTRATQQLVILTSARAADPSDREAVTTARPR